MFFRFPIFDPTGCWDRGKEYRLIPGLPSLRTVCTDLPHTALRLMVLPQKGLTGLRTGLYQIEKPAIGKVGILPPFTPCSSAVNMRSVQTEPSVHSQRLRTSKAG